MFYTLNAYNFERHSTHNHNTLQHIHIDASALK